MCAGGSSICVYVSVLCRWGQTQSSLVHMGLNLPWLFIHGFMVGWAAQAGTWAIPHSRTEATLGHSLLCCWGLGCC